MWVFWVKRILFVIIRSKYGYLKIRNNINFRFILLNMIEIVMIVFIFYDRNIKDKIKDG